MVEIDEFRAMLSGQDGNLEIWLHGKRSDARGIEPLYFVDSVNDHAGGFVRESGCLPPHNGQHYVLRLPSSLLSIISLPNHQ